MNYIAIPDVKDEAESAIDRRVRLLREQHRRMGMLLDDPHPGLMTWLEAVPRVVAEINAVMDGKRD